MESELSIGQRVVKTGEDSRFEGVIVARFVKRDGKTTRFVVENDDGVLHIASERMLTRTHRNLPGHPPSTTRSTT